MNEKQASMKKENNCLEKISQREKSGTNNCGSFTFLFIVEYYIAIMVLSDTLLIVGISTCTALLGEGEFLSKCFDSFYYS